MSDPTFESATRDAFEDTRFAGMIRVSVRDVVERALAAVPGDVHSRENLRAAGQRLGNALTAHAIAARQPATARPDRVETSSTAARPTDGADARARAFRIMAGVRS
jgi:hypothetical protein